MKIKKALWHISGFLVSFAPITVYVTLNYERYVKTTDDAVKLTIGGMIVAVIMLLKTLKKLKMPSEVVFWAIVLLVSYLLKSVINDVILISSFMLGGSGLDQFIIQPRINSINKKIDQNKMGDIISEKVFERMNNGGRV